MDQDPDDLTITISGELARRVLANITVWLESSPENDEQWIAKVRAGVTLQEDFEALIAESGAVRSVPDPTSLRPGG